MVKRTIALDVRSTGGPGTAEGFVARADQPIRSLYLHVPFCFHKCHYCDFYSFVDAQDRQEAYVEALAVELGALAAAAGRSQGTADRPTLDTVFVGGGTPTLLRVELWGRLLDVLRARFVLARDAEFTVECNPETATAELMKALARGGVNRLSIGAQSFQPAHLKTLERWHDPANVERALSLAGDAGIKRRSLDLIYAVPGQTLEDWRTDLDSALSLSPAVEHLSCYALTYEPGTAMTQRLRLGEFARADEALEARMFTLTVDVLRDHGLDRYEVSNFARPGAECRHNLAYWRQEQWLAAGPSASGHVAGCRWKNVPRISDWIAGVHAGGGFSPIVDAEGPDAARALAEGIMTGLRLREGLEIGPIEDEARTLGVETTLLRAAARHVRAGSLSADSGRWRLTDSGFLIADHVAGELMAAVRG
jgi:oxygen-independent coproporphyrinogen-3 oxidase